MFRQVGWVYHDAVLVRQVHHVDGNHHGNAHFNQLRREVQVAFEVGGVNDVDDDLCFAFDNGVLCNVLVQESMPGRAPKV